MPVYSPVKSQDGTFELSKMDLEDLRERHSSSKIHTALIKLYELNKPQDTLVSGDLAPCPDCGGIEFLRTGNCHACLTCGASQGCS